MNRFILPAALAAAGALAVPAGATAAPALKTSPSIQGSRLVVTVTSGKKFTARTRPRAVKVAVGTATYKLQQGARTARRSTWRSGALSAGQLGALYAKSVRISVKTLAGTVTQKRSTPAAPAAPGAPAPVLPFPPGGGGTYFPIQPVPVPPSRPALTVPGLTLTRDDGAGRAALGGDLLLERVESDSVTTTYHRIFLYGTGAYRFEKADREPGSGEVCDLAARVEGTWWLAEGYTFPERGGGVIVQIRMMVGTQTGSDLLQFGNGDPSTVYVGTNATPYVRNPSMPDNC